VRQAAPSSNILTGQCKAQHPSHACRILCITPLYSDHIPLSRSPLRRSGSADPSCRTSRYPPATSELPLTCVVSPRNPSPSSLSIASFYDPLHQGLRRRTLPQQPVMQASPQAAWAAPKEQIRTPSPAHARTHRHTPQSLLQANAEYIRLLPSSATTSATAFTPFRPQTAPQLEPSPGSLAPSSRRYARGHDALKESPPSARARTAPLRNCEDSTPAPSSRNGMDSAHSKAFRIPMYPAVTASLAETLNEVHLDAFSPPRHHQIHADLAFAGPGELNPCTTAQPQQMDVLPWKGSDSSTPASARHTATHMTMPQSNSAMDRSYAQRLEQQLRELERYNIALHKKVRPPQLLQTFCHRHLTVRMWQASADFLSPPSYGSHVASFWQWVSCNLNESECN
jgi:hypothetical protein